MSEDFGFVEETGITGDPFPESLGASRLGLATLEYKKPA